MARTTSGIAPATSDREIASRARGTPRIAGRLLRRVRDFADVARRFGSELWVTGQHGTLWFEGATGRVHGSTGDRPLAA